MTTTHTTHETTQHKESAHKAEPHARRDIPVLNIEKLLERFRLPGVDLPALMEAQRKNVQALQEANQKAYSGALALAKRQTEILEETMSEWQSAAKELTAKGSLENAASKQAEFARKAIAHAIDNMRELAEMAVQSQADAYAVIGKRVRAGIDEFRDYLNRKS